ncbi:MAG: ABC transporter permease [Saccharofermentans sp.]|nr:ABC transporter permease [Saccharofermentans sp.]
MLELLKFEYYRLKKNPLFWIILALCVVAPLFVGIIVRVLATMIEKGGADISDLDLSKANIKWITWFASSYFYVRLPLIMAIFTPLFIGRDYKDGIIRNKIIAGHTRLQIFATSIIVQCSVVFVFSVVYFVFGIIGMFITPFGPNINGGEMFIRAFILLISLCATVILITALSLTIKNRVLALVIAVVFVSTFNFFGTFASSYSYTPNMVDDYLDLYEDTLEKYEVYYNWDNSDIEDMIPAKSSFLGIPYYIGHPIYVLTNATMGSELIPSFSQAALLNDEIIPSYSNKVSREDAFKGNIIRAIFMDDFGSYMIDESDIRKMDGIVLPIEQVELTYTIKSIVWASIYAFCGYGIFRKKNLF